MHVVTDKGCSCLGFRSVSVCWHWALKDLLKEGSVNLSVNLGTYPMPLHAARLYLGIENPQARTFSVAAMQDTPRKRRRGKQSQAEQVVEHVSEHVPSGASGSASISNVNARVSTNCSPTVYGSIRAPLHEPCAHSSSNALPRGHPFIRARP